MLSTLPPELLVHVFRFLVNVDDVKALIRTCRYLGEVIDQHKARLEAPVDRFSIRVNDDQDMGVFKLGDPDLDEADEVVAISGIRSSLCHLLHVNLVLSSEESTVKRMDDLRLAFGLAHKLTLTAPDDLSAASLERLAEGVPHVDIASALASSVSSRVWPRIGTARLRLTGCSEQELCDIVEYKAWTDIELFHFPAAYVRAMKALIMETSRSSRIARIYPVIGQTLPPFEKIFSKAEVSAMSEAQFSRCFSYHLLIFVNPDRRYAPLFH